ncbi:MAG: hypothetical protein SFV81_08645 [Pirellulaceae bacterium]|nr:hypothetical protein [Pirellulaceae bacterium]
MLRPQQRTIHGGLNPSATFHTATRVSWKQNDPLGKPPVFSDLAPATSLINGARPHSHRQQRAVNPAD